MKVGKDKKVREGGGHGIHREVTDTESRQLSIQYQRMSEAKRLDAVCKYAQSIKEGTKYIICTPDFFCYY